MQILLKIFEKYLSYFSLFYVNGSPAGAVIT